MTSMSQAAAQVQAAPNAAHELEVKRLKFFKMFMMVSAFNNAVLALYFLGFNGGSLLAAIAAPAWVAPTIGGLGAVSVLFSIAGFLMKRWAVVGLIAAGLGALVASAMVKLFAAAGTFAFGTFVVASFARRLWHKYV